MVNKVILVGRLGKDPEVRHLENGAVVANFSLATDENYRDKNGERVSKTEWHNVAVWRKQAEIAEKYLTKGKLIYLEGKIQTRSWDDKDGNKRYTTEIVADFFQMLGGRGDQNGSHDGGMATAASERSEMDVNEDPSDDLPF